MAKSLKAFGLYSEGNALLAVVTAKLRPAYAPQSTKWRELFPKGVSSIRSFTVVRWLNVSGKGLVAICYRPNDDDFQVSDKVRLDGELYSIAAIEQQADSVYVHLVVRKEDK